MAKQKPQAVLWRFMARSPVGCCFYFVLAYSHSRTSPFSPPGGLRVRALPVRLANAFLGLLQRARPRFSTSWPPSSRRSRVGCVGRDTSVPGCADQGRPVACAQYPASSPPSFQNRAGRTSTKKWFWLYNLNQYICGYVVLYWGGQLGHSRIEIPNGAVPLYGTFVLYGLQGPFGGTLPKPEMQRAKGKQALLVLGAAFPLHMDPNNNPERPWAYPSMQAEMGPNGVLPRSRGC